MAGTEFPAQVLHSQFQKVVEVPQGPAGPTDTLHKHYRHKSRRQARQNHHQNIQKPKAHYQRVASLGRSRYRLSRGKSHTATPPKSCPTPGARSRGASRNCNKSSDYSTHTTIPTSPWDIKNPKLPRNSVWIAGFRISSLQRPDHSWSVPRHT